MSKHVLSAEEVDHVAKLARLWLSVQARETLKPQLEAILGYVDQIGRVDVEGVEPMAHATRLVNVFRDDVVGPQLEVEQVLQNAPQSDGPFFKVPKVLGGEEDSAG